MLFALYDLVYGLLTVPKTCPKRYILHHQIWESLTAISYLKYLIRKIKILCLRNYDIENQSLKNGMGYLLTSSSNIILKNLIHCVLECRSIYSGLTNTCYYSTFPTLEYAIECILSRPTELFIINSSEGHLFSLHSNRTGNRTRVYDVLPNSSYSLIKSGVQLQNTQTVD